MKAGSSRKTKPIPCPRRGALATLADRRRRGEKSAQSLLFLLPRARPVTVKVGLERNRSAMGKTANSLVSLRRQQLTPLPRGGPARLDASLEPRPSAVLRRAAAEDFPRGTRVQSCHLMLRWIEPRQDWTLVPRSEGGSPVSQSQGDRKAVQTQIELARPG